jgi:hypothetical protein
MTKLKKNDLVRVHAKHFNAPDGGTNDNGLTFEENWAREGNGEWCHGRVSFVYRKKSRESQKYRILYDDGTTMESLEEIMEASPEGDEDAYSEESTDFENETEAQAEDREDRPPVFDPRDVEGHWTGGEDQPTSMEVEESDNDSEEDDETLVVGGVHYQVSAKRKRGNDIVSDGETIKMGEVVVVGDLRWKRIEGLPEDPRTEPHLPTTFKTNLFHDETREVDVFEALMPVSKDDLLKIVRENSEELNDGRTWVMWMIDAALTIIFGGAQFKEGTDLWATNNHGLMPPPDFGKHLSRDRFKRICRYWARGLRRERERLRDNPWAQVDSWVKGFNEARLREIVAGSCVTPDEMMLEWKGKAGYGGLPHLSFIKRKPQPLGTELKSLCEGTMGMCVLIEVQKGKLRMARKKWVPTFGATTACTLRLLENFKLNEIGLADPMKRCVFADSWFASVKTALALRQHLGLHFTGPIKTAHSQFPLERMRFTLSKLQRGDHIVLECQGKDMWAIGWHDHHFKCYVTTHGHTRPGKPAPKKRQDLEGRNVSKDVPRPHILAKYQDEMGHVDRHNQYRQGLLHLAKIWKTKRWQTRVQFELLGLTIVDAFLACRYSMPKWKHDQSDEDSIFWKFVCTVISQLDARPMSARVRDGDVPSNPTFNCRQCSMGQYKIKDGAYKGSLKTKQKRCKYCRERKDELMEMGRAPPTCFECSFHKVAVCKKFNCWSRHLAEVTRDAEASFAI